MIGFYRRQAIIDARRSITRMAEKGLKNKQQGILYCTVFTLDVKVVFDSIRWVAIVPYTIPESRKAFAVSKRVTYGNESYSMTQRKERSIIIQPPEVF